jgi:hypothetical protein
MSVFLLHPHNTSLALLSAASHSIDFNQLLADGPIKLTNHSLDADGPQLTDHSPDAGERPQPISFEFQLNELPKFMVQDRAEMNRQIIALAKHCGGIIQQAWV